ncbi:MAG TPA: DUF2400 family protein, partial [Bacteroidales bacterium]|nr:DUF2400 family protein [Bacteroidales bacterium]
MELTWNQIRDLLNEKAYQYNNLDFIADDPVSVPHMFSDKADIEISGFLAATIAWGQRPVIIRNAKHLMQLMDYQPFDFVVNAQKDDLRQLDHFKHRTFNGQDCAYFVRAL